jgi:hypothetical protein
MTHLIIGAYTEQGATGVWANLELDAFLLEGVIHRAETMGAYPFLVRVMAEDVRIIKPKRLTIFTNDRSLAESFTRPIRLEFGQFDLVRQLAAYNIWRILHQENLPKAKELCKTLTSQTQ